jgi:signal transduction histidine kinase
VEQSSGESFLRPENHSTRLTPEAVDHLLALLQKALGHELPNQLIAVQGLAHLLELEAASQVGEEGREYLNRLSAAAQRSHVMVRSLADFVRALRVAGPIARIALPEVVREAAGELSVLFPGRSIEYHFPEQGPFVWMPAGVLRQIAGHLLRHAHQAAPPPRRCIDTGASESAAAVTFWVCNPDRFLSAEEHPKMFEPFACRDTSGSGFGLSLVLARQLVECWRGRLTVESAADRGTTLKVVFPKDAS